MIIDLYKLKYTSFVWAEKSAQFLCLGLSIKESLFMTDTDLSVIFV